MPAVAEKKETRFGGSQGKRRVRVAGTITRAEKRTEKQERLERLKGSFSKEVTESYRWKQYVGNGLHVGGYIGSLLRSPRRDKILEKILREHGLGVEGIPYWLSSTQARHMMNDSVDTIKAFEKRAREYTKDAFWSVLIWGHPDNYGSLASQYEIENKIIAAAKEELKREGRRQAWLKKKGLEDKANRGGWLKGWPK